jgi:hypothetical protein
MIRKENLHGLCIDERIILKWALKRMCARVGTTLIWLKIGAI